MTNVDDERERAAKRQKRNADLFTNAKNELEKLENEHLEALEVIDEANAHLTSRCRQVHLKAEGLSSTDRREFERHIKRLEEAEKRVSDIERIDLTSLTTRKKNKRASECPTKKKKAQPLVVCTPKLTTEGAKCMAILCKTGKPCTFQAEDGFLTCRYPWHRAQEEELKKKAVPRVDSNASTADQSPFEVLVTPIVTEADRFGRNQDDLMDRWVRQSQPQQRDKRQYKRTPYNFIDIIERNERFSEEEAKRKAEEEAEAKRKAEEEAKAKRKAEEEAKAKRKAEEEAESITVKVAAPRTKAPRREISSRLVRAEPRRGRKRKTPVVDRFL